MTCVISTDGALLHWIGQLGRPIESLTADGRHAFDAEQAGLAVEVGDPDVLFLQVSDQLGRTEPYFGITGERQGGP